MVKHYFYKINMKRIFICNNYDDKKVYILDKKKLSKELSYMTKSCLSQ